jgi:hypothetical protein
MQGARGSRPPDSPYANLASSAVVCQGRLKSGPLAPVEKWPTCAGLDGDSDLRREAEPVGRGRGGDGRFKSVSRGGSVMIGALCGVLRPSARWPRVIGQPISGGLAPIRASRSLPRSL